MQSWVVAQNMQILTQHCPKDIFPTIAERSPLVKNWGMFQSIDFWSIWGTPLHSHREIVKIDLHCHFWRVESRWRVNLRKFPHAVAQRRTFSILRGIGLIMKEKTSKNRYMFFLTNLGFLCGANLPKFSLICSVALVPLKIGEPRFFPRNFRTFANFLFFQILNRIEIEWVKNANVSEIKFQKVFWKENLYSSLKIAADARRPWLLYLSLIAF